MGLGALVGVGVAAYAISRRERGQESAQSFSPPADLPDAVSDTSKEFQEKLLTEMHHIRVLLDKPYTPYKTWDDRWKARVMIDLPEEVKKVVSAQASELKRRESEHRENFGMKRWLEPLLVQAAGTLLAAVITIAFIAIYNITGAYPYNTRVRILNFLGLVVLFVTMMAASGRIWYELISEFFDKVAWKARRLKTRSITRRVLVALIFLAKGIAWLTLIFGVIALLAVLNYYVVLPFTTGMAHKDKP
jgi:hypothetical protein